MKGITVMSFKGREGMEEIEMGYSSDLIPREYIVGQYSIYLPFSLMHTSGVIDFSESCDEK